MRKRKVPVERAPVAKRTRKAVPLQRFSLDDDEDSGDASDLGEEFTVPTEEPIGGTNESQIDNQTTAEPAEAMKPTREPIHHTTSLAIVDSMIPEETDPTSPPPPLPSPTEEDTSSWIQTRRLVPEATFDGISVWHADEAMYTVPSTGADEGAEREEGEKVLDEGGVRAAMGERDEFVRALDEWRSVGEVVHAW
jgi:hypothetical protein